MALSLCRNSPFGMRAFLMVMNGRRTFRLDKGRVSKRPFR